MVGVVVNGQPYSAKVCYEKGLVHDPVSSGAWFSLGSIAMMHSLTRAIMRMVLKCIVRSTMLCIQEHGHMLHLS